jgi:hypothetical protein
MADRQSPIPSSAQRSARPPGSPTGGPDGPVDRQAWFQEQLDAPTAEQQLQLIARNARWLNDRPHTCSSSCAPPPPATARSPPSHTLWALTVPELYVLHVTQSGRHPDTYQHWLADVLIAVLLAH